MKKIITVVLIVLGFTFAGLAQELRCNVTVSARGIEGANQNMFRTMQSDLYEFMNNRKWTDHAYTYDEKIKCNILVDTITFTNKTYGAKFTIIFPKI